MGKEDPQYVFKLTTNELFTAAVSPVSILQPHLL